MKYLILVITILLSSHNLYAWGPKGHRIIGNLAQKDLTPKVQKKINLILSNRTLADVSLWADKVKVSKKYKHTSRWHYINVEKGKYYDGKKSKKGNLLDAINKQLKKLKSKKSNDEKEVALKFLVHFIGDLHQPLHNGYSKDRGGNEVKFNWLRKGTNLHYLWDSLIIDYQRMSYTEYANYLNNKYKKANEQFNTKSIIKWHNESRTYLDALYNINKKRSWEKFYMFKNLDNLEKSLYLAGKRLALVLNNTL